jgi:hypothetical protein
MLILAGKDRYEVIDLAKNQTFNAEDSSLLQQAALCYHGETNSLFITYFASESSGFSLGKIEMTHLQKETVPFLDTRIGQIKQAVSVEGKDKSTSGTDKEALSRKEWPHS